MGTELPLFVPAPYPLRGEGQVVRSTLSPYTLDLSHRRGEGNIAVQTARSRLHRV